MVLDPSCYSVICYCCQLGLRPPTSLMHANLCVGGVVFSLSFLARTSEKSRKRAPREQRCDRPRRAHACMQMVCVRSLSFKPYLENPMYKCCFASKCDILVPDTFGREPSRSRPPRTPLAVSRVARACADVPVVGQVDGACRIRHRAHAAVLSAVEAGGGMGGAEPDAPCSGAVGGSTISLGAASR